MKTLAGALALAAFGICRPLTAQMVVYENFAPPGWQPYYAPADTSTEFGDEIILAPNTPRLIDAVSFQLYTANLSGDEWLKMRLYHNDGPLSNDGFPTPNTLFFQSDASSLGWASGRAVLTLDDLHVTVPDTFTWTVQFGGLSPGETAGLAINGPPTQGDSYDDFWEKKNGSWGSLAHITGSLESSFGAQITAVPEPSATPYALLVAAIGSVACHRVFRFIPTLRSARR